MEDQANKQEPATPYKLQEARKKGQIAKSPELISVLTLAAWSFGLLIVLPQLANTIINSTRAWLYQAHALATSYNYLSSQLLSVLAELMYILMPVIILALIVVIGVSITINGPVFSSFPIKPDFSRLNPAQGFKKLFSKKALIELAKLIVKLGFLAVAAYQIYEFILVESLRALFVNQHDLGEHAIWLAKKILLIILAIMLLAAVIDHWYNRRDFARQMRMSRRDLRDEIKRREGDQDIKAKRKKTQSELLKKISAIGQVKDADLIITNPTHYAVALQYRANTMIAPIVLASGRGFLAKLIMQRARRFGVRIYRRPPLARYVYKNSGIGNPIPAEKQKEVAQLYREAMEQISKKVFGK